jgi:hypothetical protein
MAPAATQTSGSQCVFQANCKYVADGEQFSKADDETPLVTATVPNTIRQRFQDDITLDRTKMAADDHFGLELRRKPGNASDDRNGDIYVVSAWFIADASAAMET